jgi:predicted alpha/beta hydrolase family esterase
MSTLTTLILPGVRGSGDAHWQSYWERAHPEYRRVHQRNWDQPDLVEWADTVAATARETGKELLLVAHSFGCLVAARVAAMLGKQVRGGLLVAPADPARFEAEHLIPQAGLAIPTVMVASSNDPWLALPRAHAMAATWGSRWINLGDAGHINADSGHGAWPEGWFLLEQLRWAVERTATNADPEPLAERREREPPRVQEYTV